MTDVPFSKAELFQEASWRKCAQDPVFFFENYWRIQHPERGQIPFELFDAQRDALRVFQAERYVVTLKARQIGWTTLVAAYSFWLAFFHEDRLVIFLSKGEREAKTILDKVRYGHKRLPEWLRARGPKLLRDNQQEFPLSNGSAIESLPSKSDPARGRSCYLVIVDEWAFLENPVDAWASIEPIADVGGRVIGLSTANGWGNFFHSLWVGARTGTNQFVPIFEAWDARAERDAAWYEVKRRSLPEWQLHQEYPRTEDEAFIQGGNPFFDTARLAEFVLEDGRVGEVVAREFRTFVERSGGPLEMWELPQDGDQYVIGADVAEGLEHGDFSSAHVIRLRSGLVVAHWHGHVPPDEFGDVLADLGWFYNRALVGVENNNHGLTTCVALKGAKYPNIFYSRIVDERSRRETRKIGWSTTRKTRPMMLDDLYAALRDDSITVRDRETVGELRTFIRDESARLHGSPFDDRTISLAIAVQMMAYAHQHDYKVQNVEWGQLAWWDQVDSHETAVPTIGSHNVRWGPNGPRIPGTV